ncbi:MAG: Flp pilus assembly protein CpaB [Alphaproteobacteria bacterium]
MLSRKIFLVLAIVGVAAMFGMIARSLFSSQEEDVAVAAPPVEEPEPVAPGILVAVEDLPAGEFIKPVNVRWQEWPEDSILDAHIVEGDLKIEDLVGAVVRSGIVAGEPVVAAKLVRPGERGFLAAVLSPGMRAISVPVNAVSGNAGLIFPGDRVDVILTQSLKLPDTSVGLHMVSETILARVRVIAVDQRVQDIAPEEEEGSAPVAKTVTLEVTPRQAESVAIATELGRLSLSLRSLGVPDEIAGEVPERTPVLDLSEPKSPTFASDVSTAFGRATGNDDEITVMRGSETTVVKP